jgi:hypothetical protein
MRAVTTTKTRAMKRARVTKRARATRTMAEHSPREKGDYCPPPAERVHNNQLLRRNFKGKERGGGDSEGDDEGGKGDSGRGYEDDGGDGGEDDAKRR